MSKLRNQNWIMIISLVLWCAITLIRVMHHSPWYDEAHAWLIAQELNLLEIIKLMKIEGHTILWYLCLMPFAKSNFMYPYSMLLINWLFCFIAILILWLKAPFNNWIKFLISFSFPFLVVYSVLARCYAIGIMFLFSLTAMENKKLEHPNWYALLLILCANTSVTAAVGATVFGLLFIYELIKSKKNLIIPFVVMGTGSLLVLYQLFGSTKDIFGDHNPMGAWFVSNVFFTNSILNIIILSILAIFIITFYAINKIFPYFLVLSYLILFVIICIYSGNIWHWFFFYIYFIISSWLLFTKYKFRCQNVYVLVLCIISFMYILYKPSVIFYKYVLSDKSKYISESIIKYKNYEEFNIIIPVFNYYSVIPYLNKTKIKLSNYCSGKLANYDTVPFSRSKYCYFDDYTNSVLAFEQLDKVYDENRKNIMLSNGTDGPFNLIGKNSKFMFIPIITRKDDDMTIYSITKVNN